ncbi:MAG: hypothetical protein U0401_25965 [Anaerolineae bacterium]
MNDQAFFSRSGEAKQRHTGQKVGDILGASAIQYPRSLTGWDETIKREMLSLEYVEEFTRSHRCWAKTSKALVAYSANYSAKYGLLSLEGELQERYFGVR